MRHVTSHFGRFTKQHRETHINRPIIEYGIGHDKLLLRLRYAHHREWAAFTLANRLK